MNVKAQRDVFLVRNALNELSRCLTGEEEEAALNCASNRLQLDHIHGLTNVHCAGHAP